jgi:hypothetical protein
LPRIFQGIFWFFQIFPNFSKLFFGGFVGFQRLAREKRKKEDFQIFAARSTRKASAREIPERVRELGIRIRHGA